MRQHSRAVQCNTKSNYINSLEIEQCGECLNELGLNVSPTTRSYRFKVSSERPEQQGVDLAIPGVVVLRDIHHTTAVPLNGGFFQCSTFKR